MTMRAWETALAAAKRLVLRFPAVAGVDYGYAYRADVRSTELCVRFHVKRKLPRHALRAHELLPSEIGSIRCDVLQARYTPYSPPHSILIATFAGEFASRGADAREARALTSVLRAEIGCRGVEEPKLGLALISAGTAAEITRTLIDGIEGTFELDFGAYGDRKRWLEGSRLIPDSRSPASAGADIAPALAMAGIWMNPETQRVVALNLAGENGAAPASASVLVLPVSRMLGPSSIASCCPD